MNSFSQNISNARKDNVINIDNPPLSKNKMQIMKIIIDGHIKCRSSISLATIIPID